MSKFWKKRKPLRAFDDIFAHFISSNNSNSVVTELFTRGRKYTFLFLLLRDHALKYQKMLN